jgi:hypothetical protein
MATLTYKKRPVIKVLDNSSNAVEIMVGNFEDLISKNIIQILKKLPGVTIEGRYDYTVSIDLDFLDLNHFKLYLEELFKEFYFEIDFENPPKPLSLAGYGSGGQE